VTEETAAVVLEPIQGEAGVVVPPRDYLARAREITGAAGALLWLDEVQTGIGRTGAWFAHQNPEVCDPLPSPPDLVTVAKGLAGGFPIGACVALGESADLLQPGNHGTTFGGNPVACAAALAVISTIDSEGLLAHATVLGHRIRDGIAADPRVAEVTGSGLLIGIVLHDRGAVRVAEAALADGFIINPATVERIRLAPPLVLTEADADALIKAFPTWLDEVL
jgi:acetylornithine aminotransferase